MNMKTLKKFLNKKIKLERDTKKKYSLSLYDYFKDSINDDFAYNNFIGFGGIDYKLSTNEYILKIFKRKHNLYYFSDLDFKFMDRMKVLKIKMGLKDLYLFLINKIKEYYELIEFEDKIKENELKNLLQSKMDKMKNGIGIIKLSTILEFYDLYLSSNNSLKNKYIKRLEDEKIESYINKGILNPNKMFLVDDDLDSFEIELFYKLKYNIKIKNEITFDEFLINNYKDEIKEFIEGLLDDLFEYFPKLEDIYMGDDIYFLVDDNPFILTYLQYWNDVQRDNSVTFLFDLNDEIIQNSLKIIYMNELINKAIYLGLFVIWKELPIYESVFEITGYNYGINKMYVTLF